MAAPTPTTRATPSGIVIPEGFRSLITFARKSNIAFWEKSVTSAGLDGGDKIDITTQHNQRVKTFYPRRLFSGSDGSIKVAIDAKAKNDVMNILLNQPDTITELFPDGSTYCYYGYLQKFEMGEFVEGGFPEATVTIVQTNYDHVNRVEALPVFTEVTGT